MKFGVILAGGVGNRMGAEKPKQFIEIAGKPIISYTIEAFLKHDELEKIIVLTPEEWVDYTSQLITDSIGKDDRLTVIPGGAVRNETIMNAIAYIEQNYGLDKDTIIVTHDAVRPFVTQRIISDNIEAAMKYGACDTVIPATDTIVRSADGNTIAEIPDRSKLYQGQTPQSFRAAELKELYSELTEEEKKILTDAAKIYVIKGRQVYLVQGEPSNMKITYPYDIHVAESIIKGDRNE